MLTFQENCKYCEHVRAKLINYGLPVYGAVDSDLTVIQNVLDRCFKRKYTSKRMDIRELLEKADKKLFKVRSVDQKQKCSSSGDKD